MALNRQPIFTATPILATNQFDPPVPATFRNPGLDSSTAIYTDSSTYGSLITKVTVTATAVLGDNTTTKVIYLAIEDTGSSIITLYQSKIMTGISNITATQTVPFVVFDLGTGLNMNPNSGYVLRIAASTNKAATGENGDEVNVVVEGGTYDI